MRAGALRHRIEIQYKDSGRDDYGERNGEWKRLAMVWAAINTKNAREYVAAQKTVGESDFVFEIRHLKGVTNGMRILYDGCVYEIVAPPMNVGERNVNMYILARLAA
jgi:SPP1 family predicted phage head-tail adaptor